MPASLELKLLPQEDRIAVSKPRSPISPGVSVHLRTSLGHESRLAAKVYEAHADHPAQGNGEGRLRRSALGASFRNQGRVCNARTERSLTREVRWIRPSKVGLSTGIVGTLTGTDRRIEGRLWVLISRVLPAVVKSIGCAPFLFLQDEPLEAVSLAA